MYEVELNRGTSCPHRIGGWCYCALACGFYPNECRDILIAEFEAELFNDSGKWWCRAKALKGD